MNKIERFIVQNWIWIIIGCLLEAKAFKYAASMRTCNGIGGELFVLPICIIFGVAIRKLKSYLGDEIGCRRTQG